jgi:hypothetical protein
MLKVSLPNGVVIEGSTPQEVAETLSLLGFGDGRGTISLPASDLAPQHAVQVIVSSAERQGVPSPFKRPREAEHPTHWTPDAVGALLQGLPDGGRNLLRLLLEVPRPVPTIVLARALDLADPKPIGPMLASIRRRAAQMGKRNPVISESRLGVTDNPSADEHPGRFVHLELEFRDAAHRHLRGER